VKKRCRKHAGNILTAVLLFSCRESPKSGPETSVGEAGDVREQQTEIREEEETSAFQETAEKEDAVSGRPQMEVYLQDNRLDEWAGANALAQIGYDSLQINEQAYPEFSLSVENYNR